MYPYRHSESSENFGKLKAVKEIKFISQEILNLRLKFQIIQTQIMFDNQMKHGNRKISLFRIY